MTVAQPSAGDTPLVHKPGRLSRRGKPFGLWHDASVGVHGYGNCAVSAAGDVLDIGKAD